MKNFLEKHYVAIAISAVVSTILVVLLGSFLFESRQIHQQTLVRLDQQAPGTELKGPMGGVSDRSKHQLDVMLSENPHVLGGWFTKLDYGKTENPVIYISAKDPIANEAAQALIKSQVFGTGRSSDEQDEDKKQTIRNSDEAKAGLVRCGLPEETTLVELLPSIKNSAVRGVCRATIPPFDPSNNIAVIVLVDVDGSKNNADIRAIRRTLLQLQIDVFNRDYAGRETWVHE